MTRNYHITILTTLSLMAILSTGCQTIRYKFGAESNGSGEEILHSTWLLGLIENKQIKAKKHCPIGFSKITSQRSLFNFIPYLSFIWLPRDVAIDCSDTAMAGSANNNSNSGNPGSNNTNTNNNNITIQISPDLIKKP
jgi:hypothetical protein